MIRPALLLTALPLALLLSACGVDGPPVRPSQVPDDERGPNMVVSGSVGLGVGGRL